MGLDTTHGAFSGSYSAFFRFRATVSRACGHANLDPLSEAFDYVPEDYRDTIPVEYHAGLIEFLRHSDCDGAISPTDCISVAAFLRWVAPKLDSQAMSAAAIRFAEGCERAAAAGEDLEFE